MTVIDFSKLHFGDGRHFDRLYEKRTEDKAFYLRKARAFGDPVLELGSGTGRVAIPIAEEGLDVTGVELLESMVKCAREKATRSKVEWTSIVSDFRRAKLDKTYRTIIGPFNFMGNFLTDSELASVLGKVRSILDDSGRFVFDVGNPLAIQKRAKGELVTLGEYADPVTSETIVLKAHSEMDYSQRTQNIVHQYTFASTGRTIEYDFELRAFWPEDLPRLLGENGFEIESLFGDFSESPFQDSSKFQVVIAAKN